MIATDTTTEDRITAAFDRMVERRRRTTDVPAALVDVVERRPWWRTWPSLAVVATAGAAAAIVFIALVTRSSDTTDAEIGPADEPPVEPAPSAPAPTFDTVVPETTPAVVEDPDISVEPARPTDPFPVIPAPTPEAAIGEFLAARGDGYAGSCGTEVAQLSVPCSRVGVTDGGTTPYMLDDAAGLAGLIPETLLLRPHDGGWVVVDTRLDGYSLVSRQPDLPVIDWVSPDGTTAAHEIDAYNEPADIIEIYADLLVAEDLSRYEASELQPCRQVLWRIDSATGTVTEFGRGLRPVLDPTGRFVASVANEHHGSVPPANERCWVLGDLVVLDLHTGEQSIVSYTTSGDLGGIGRFEWSPSGSHIAVEDGPDSTRSSIVAVTDDGSTTRIDLDRDVPELGGLISNEIVGWESAEVLVVRFYEFAGEAQPIEARYGVDGRFISLVG